MIFSIHLDIKLIIRHVFVLTFWKSETLKLPKKSQKILLPRKNDISNSPTGIGLKSINTVKTHHARNDYLRVWLLRIGIELTTSLSGFKEERWLERWFLNHRIFRYQYFWTIKVLKNTLILHFYFISRYYFHVNLLKSQHFLIKLIYKSFGAFNTNIDFYGPFFAHKKFGN